MAEADGTDTGTDEATTSESSATNKKWYIVHTYSGQEARAKNGLLERAKTMGFDDRDVTHDATRH